MTVRQIAACLEAHGIGDALWEALLLAEHFTGRSRSLWRADMDTDIPVPALGEAVGKRSTRYPLQYLLGAWEFMGLPFVVREGCLIPRPDTEILAEAAIEAANVVLRTKGSVRVLDLCTGSGCILASVLHYCPAAEGVAVDLYPDALAVAEENFTRLGLTNRVTLLQGDVRKDIFPPEEQFDLILSNPPYVTADEMTVLEPELAHEPATALTDGGNGLSLYEAILQNYLPHLTEGGTILFEHGAAQSNAVLKMGKACGLTGKALYDYSGHKRCAVLRRESFSHQTQ